MNTPTIITNRLILRKFTKDDLEAFYRIYQDEKVNTFLPWFPLKSLEEAKDFFNERYQSVYDQEKGYKYAICLKSNNIPIGYVNVSLDDSHDFGYGLLEEYWRQGIVSEASRAVIEQLKKDGFLYITATHDVNNPSSGHVMQALGMEYKYSYEELWQPKNFLVTFRMYQLNFDDNQKRVYKKYWDMYPNHFIEQF